MGRYRYTGQQKNDQKRLHWHRHESIACLVKQSLHKRCFLALVAGACIQGSASVPIEHRGSTETGPPVPRLVRYKGPSDCLECAECAHRQKPNPDGSSGMIDLSQNISSPALRNLLSPHGTVFGGNEPNCATNLFIMGEFRNTWELLCANSRQRQSWLWKLSKMR